MHGAGLVSYYDNLSSAGVHGGVHYATELGGEEAGAVHDYGGVAGGVVGRGFGDVCDNAAFDCYIVFETSAQQPGEVNGCVDADGLEGCAGIAGGWEFGFREGS